MRFPGFSPGFLHLSSAFLSTKSAKLKCLVVCEIQYATKSIIIKSTLCSFSWPFHVITVAAVAVVIVGQHFSHATNYCSSIVIYYFLFLFLFLFCLYVGWLWVMWCDLYVCMCLCRVVKRQPIIVRVSKIVIIMIIVYSVYSTT